MNVPNPFLKHVKRQAEHEEHVEKIKLAWLTFCDRLEAIKRKAEYHNKNV